MCIVFISDSCCSSCMSLKISPINSPHGGIPSSCRHFLQYPSKWAITIKNGPGNYLFKIGNSVCTNVEVNYTAEGGAYFYDKSGAPVSVGLSLTMQETAITTQSEIQMGA